MLCVVELIHFALVGIVKVRTCPKSQLVLPRADKLELDIRDKTSLATLHLEHLATGDVLFKVLFKVLFVDGTGFFAARDKHLAWLLFANLLHLV